MSILLSKHSKTLKPAFLRQGLSIKDVHSHGVCPVWIFFGKEGAFFVIF